MLRPNPPSIIMHNGVQLTNKLQSDQEVSQLEFNLISCCPVENSGWGGGVVHSFKTKCTQSAYI